MKDTGRSYASSMSHRIAGVGELMWRNRTFCPSDQRLSIFTKISLSLAIEKPTSVQSVIRMKIIHPLVNGFCVSAL